MQGIGGYKVSESVTVSEKNIVVEIESNVAILKINRPKMLNALNTETLKELEEAFNSLEENKSVRVIVLTGEGKAFVAGADISEMKDMSPEEARNFAAFGQKIFRKIETSEKPTIAAMNGFALGGGCELAMCCDIRLVSNKAKIGLPEVSLGITPGFAGTQRLPRIVGSAKAKELIFTAGTINAEEALEIGLVNRVIEDEELMEKAMEMANTIASRSFTAIKYAKKAVTTGSHVDMETANAIEADSFALCFASADQKEGMSAFLEKRKPKFKINS